MRDMRGSIVKRKRCKTYSIVISQKDEEGKWGQKWISTGAKTKREAQAALTETLHKINTGAYVSPSKLTLSLFLEQWLSGYARVNTSSRTYERYHELVEKHIVPSLGNITLASLKPGHIQTFYGKLLESGRRDGKGGLSAQTVLHIHRLLFQALRFGVRQSIIGRNVAESVAPPQPKYREMPFTDSLGIARLLDAFKGSEYYVPIVTAAYTGLRRSELLALTWQNISLELATLSVNRSIHKLRSGEYIIKAPKSKRGRRNISLSPSLALMLGHYKEKQSSLRKQLDTTLEETALVFSHVDGSPIRPDTITRAFRDKAKEVGLSDLTFHGLRHTHAVLMLAANVHPKIVSERLGHSTVSITLDLYSHVLPGLQEAAAKRFEDVVGPIESVQEFISNPLAISSYVKT